MEFAPRRYTNSRMPMSVGEAQTMTEMSVIPMQNAAEMPVSGVTALSTVSCSALSLVSKEAQLLLVRMFADPYLLSKENKADLAGLLRLCVRANPQVAELRVLLGMALCVN